MKEAFITLVILLVAIAVIFVVNSEPSKQLQLYNEQIEQLRELYNV